MKLSILSVSIRGALLLSAGLGLSGCLSGSGGDDDSSTPPQSSACNSAENAVQVNEMCIQTVTVASPAKAAQTPGTAGVVVTHPKLINHLGADADLNQARYTRYALADQTNLQPDAILVAVPGTLGGAHNYFRLAENLMADAQAAGLVMEVWAFERRSVLLQDTVGLNIAEAEKDPLIAVNFLFGQELDLPLSPELDRHAVFYDQTDVPFMANWTPQVFSQDIDVVVELARDAARNGNVFLGGHSAGTGFVARYAATDFNLSGSGAPEPGYAKLRGLVLFEGQGGSLRTTAPTSVELDAVEATADGGLYAAAQTGKVSSYINAPGLGPKQLVSSEVLGMQMAFEETINGEQAVLQQTFGPDRNGAGNSVYQQVEGYNDRAFPVTAGAALATFQDDDNQPTPQFYHLSMGALGALNADGLVEWLDNDQPLPASAFTDNGPAPASVLSAKLFWGVEVEPVNLARLTAALFVGETNYSDWYYPSTGLLIGNNATVGGANLGLDTSALSLPVALGGRGRSDIVNQTQAQQIDVPVIGFGGTNGLTPVPGIWRGFANAIAPCSALSCDGTSRMLSGANDFSAFPTFGGAEGGFEVYMSEGYSHNDVLAADDDATNNVIDPLLAFIERNTE
ncbi:MAG: hypothetical protein V7681_04370 [Halopseudomonas sabulinigri]|mgnify:FL=1